MPIARILPPGPWAERSDPSPARRRAAAAQPVPPVPVSARIRFPSSPCRYLFLREAVDDQLQQICGVAPASPRCLNARASTSGRNRLLETRRTRRARRAPPRPRRAGDRDPPHRSDRPQPHQLGRGIPLPAADAGPDGHGHRGAPAPSSSLRRSAVAARRRRRPRSRPAPPPPSRRAPPPRRCRAALDLRGLRGRRDHRLGARRRRRRR